jgi:hypothetical protein
MKSLKKVSIITFLLLLASYLILLSNSQQFSVVSDPEKHFEKMTKMYEELKIQYTDSDVTTDQNFVIELKSAKGQTLASQLTRLRNNSKPISSKWSGNSSTHPFMPGDTLKGQLEQITQKEQINLIWWLDRDFIVKHPFRVEDNVIGTLNQIVKAIDSDFEMTVHGFLCPQQRALVITDEPINYLHNKCINVKK